jgi:60 kDa SS-A/Ro ribonucleoprotein
MRNLNQYFNTRNQISQTPQSQPLSGMVPNSAGGYSYEIDDFQKVERFLKLGTEGGTYYIGEKQLTKQNAEAVVRALAKDARRVIEMARDVSVNNKTIKNDYPLFVLAMATAPDFVKSATDRAYAWKAFQEVARTGTHLLQFVNFMESFRGWGKAAKGAVATWFNSQSVDKLEYQLLKYRDRAGWHMRDVLRMAHPNPEETFDNDNEMSQRKALYRWVTKDERSNELPIRTSKMLALQKDGTNVKQVLKYVNDFKLPWEAIPYQFLNDKEVLKSTLKNMPIGATIRQLGKLTAHGVLAPLSDEVDLVIERLTNEQSLAKARIHPVQILLAQKVYESGHGVKGSLSWQADRRILQALEEVFYLAFKFVVPTGKKIAVAVDCSGSMTGGYYNNSGALSPAEIAAAMATVIINTEPKSVLMKFDTRAQIVNYPVSARVSDIHRIVNNMSSGTDIACPINELINQNIKVDAIVLLTDSETWAGNMHVTEAARNYVRRFGRTKFVNVAAVANFHTTLDPKDVNALEVIGFDGTVPQVINDFIRD